jgi:small subunit ribosomal protein S9
MIDEEREDTPQDEQTPEEPTAAETPAEEPEAEAPAEEQPAAEEQPTAEEPASEEPAADPAAGEPAAEEPVADEPVTEEPAGEEAAAEAPKPKPKPDRKKEKADEPEAIPGAHLEPDLVLEDEAREDERVYAGAEVDEDAAPVAQEDAAAPSEDDEAKPEEPLSAVLDLAADARYRATGKRKNAVARVTLKPGTGEYTINGRALTDYFPRATLQTQARRPLETVGQQERMDVVATIHGGGVSAQAGALRHGITRALVEADPNLRGELKRRGFLTRDPRVKERKKAGLKKARKRPQFSKR